MAVNIPDLKNKIVNYVRTNGPCLPVQLSKQIHSNILFAGAVLSELVANNKIKISKAKIGGSPVYYVDGQEPKLTILYPHLHEKEKKAYDLLKENKVLHDRSLEPWQRVALRELNDFAFPTQINNEIFWRWYMFSEEESHKIIQDFLEKNSQEVKEEVKLEPQVVQKMEPKIDEQKLVVDIKPQITQEIKIQQEIPKDKIEQTKLEPLQEKIEIKRQIEKPKKIKKVKKDANIFHASLINYLQRKRIEKLQEEIIKKDKEFEIIANIPSSFGLVRFFIMATDKKKISDADLSLAHNKAQLKKLPLIFISNGELTKQAQEYIKKNYLVFEKI